MIQTSLYAIVDEKGRIISYPMEIHVRLYKKKKYAMVDCDKNEKVIKVRIVDYKINNKI